MANPVHLFDSEGAEIDASTRLQSLVESRSMSTDRAATTLPVAPYDNIRRTTLDPSAGYVTIINTYNVEPERAEAVLNALVSATEETLRFVPGFVSANLHLSVDGTQVINYAQWQSREAVATAGADPKVAARIQEIAAMVNSFAPILFDLRNSIAAPTP